MWNRFQLPDFFGFCSHSTWVLNPKNRGIPTLKMDGENNGSKPYEQMDDLRGFPIIFGNTLPMWLSFGIHSSWLLQHPVVRPVTCSLASFHMLGGLSPQSWTLQTIQDRIVTACRSQLEWKSVQAMDIPMWYNMQHLRCHIGCKVRNAFKRVSPWNLPGIWGAHRFFFADSITNSVQGGLSLRLLWCVSKL